jgi:hypothetical protein
MNKLNKLTFFFLFLASQAFCQEKKSISILDSATNELENSLAEELNYFYVNKPSEDAIITFTKFISCFRFPDILGSSAPIQYTNQITKGLKSLKVIDDRFSVPTYYAEFDTAGRYKKINYYEVYASPPYYSLIFDYDKREKFAEVINTYGNKNELFLEFYAIEDTIIQKSNYPAMIYPDAFDVYKRAFYNKDLHLFDLSKAAALDKKEQYRMSEGTHCTYSTRSKNVYQYDYSYEVDERNGYEIIYYNDKNQLVKVEIFEKGVKKHTITITYKYYTHKN